MKKTITNLFLKLILVLPILFVSNASFAQENKPVEITLDENTNMYGYTEVFEFEGAKKEDIKKAILAAIPQQNLITYQDENQIVLNYSNIKVGTYTYISFKEKFTIKDGKLKWEITDLYHLFYATQNSKPIMLHEIKSKKVFNDALNLFNTLLVKSRDYTKASIVVTSTEEDW